MNIIIILLTVLTALDFQAFPEKQSASQLTIQEIDNQYHIFDMDTGEVLKVSKTEAAVDSLIVKSSELRGKDTRGSFQSARQAFIISQDLNYQNGLARSHNLLGINYFDFGDYERAVNHYFSAIKIEEALDNDDRIASILNNFALVYAEQGNYDMTAYYLMESIEKRKSIGQTSEAFTSTNNLGVLHRRQGEYDKALDYFYMTAKGSLEEEPDSNLYMTATLNIGNTYRNQGEFEKALPYLVKAADYFENNSQRLNQVYVNLFLSNLYRDKMELETALKHALTSIELAQVERHREGLKDAHQLAAEIYELNGDFRKAHAHFQTFHQITDTLNNSERVQRINELQIRFDVEQKDKEIELLNRESDLKQAELARQDLLKNFLLAGVLFLIVITVLLTHMNRTKKRNNLSLRESREEIKEQNLQLNRLNREKDEFLNMAVHDLRNPLSSIIMITDLIREEDNISDSELNEYSNLIHISAEKMISLVNNLLDIQNKSALTANEELNIVEILKHSVENFKKTATRKNINLKCAIKDDPILVYGHSNNLVRIFDNLISNSLKYSPFNTTVNISVVTYSEHVRVTFKDEGPGISKDEQRNLFRQFGTTSNKPTGNEGSVGLGLYIVKKFTKAMNGNVWCKSEPGMGAEFIFELPLAEKTNSVSEPETEVSYLH